MKKCVIYARFSPRPQGKLATLATADQQVQVCTEHATNNGMEILATITDEQVSRDQEIKPGLEEALAILKRGQVLLIAKPDRLGGGYPAAYIRNFCEKRGISIVCVEGGADESTAEGKLINGILDQVSQYEQRIISRRTKALMLYRQEQGEMMSQRPPTGYKLDPKNPKRMIRCPKEQKAVKDILFLRSGPDPKSYGEICDILNSVYGGYRGGKWIRSTVHRTFKRETATKGK